MTDTMFTRADLAQIVSVSDILTDFENFVLRRFADYTRHTMVIAKRGDIVNPIADVFERTNAGYGHWRVKPTWSRTQSLGDEFIVVEHYVDEDRGAGGVRRSVNVPLDFIFGEVEKHADYEAYLRLKAQFEPDTTTAAPPAPQPDKSDEIARSAARHMLYLLPQDQRVSVTTMVADTVVAARIYREALKATEGMGARGEQIRADLHAGAGDLGLDPIKEPDAT